MYALLEIAGAEQQRTRGCQTCPVHSECWLSYKLECVFRPTTSCRSWIDTPSRERQERDATIHASRLLGSSNVVGNDLLVYDDY